MKSTVLCRKAVLISEVNLRYMMVAVLYTEVVYFMGSYQKFHCTINFIINLLEEYVLSLWG